MTEPICLARNDALTIYARETFCGKTAAPEQTFGPPQVRTPADVTCPDCLRMLACPRCGAGEKPGAVCEWIRDGNCTVLYVSESEVTICKDGLKLNQIVFLDLEQYGVKKRAEVVRIFVRRESRDRVDLEVLE